MSHVQSFDWLAAERPILIHGGPSQRLHCGCLVAAQFVSDIALSQPRCWLRPTEFLATLPALAVAAKAGKSAQRGSSPPCRSLELRDDVCGRRPVRLEIVCAQPVGGPCGPMRKWLSMIEECVEKGDDGIPA